MIAWNPYILWLSFHFKSEYICESFVPCIVLSRKGTCMFLLFRVCFRYMLLIVKLPFCTLVIVGLSGPLPEMVKGMCLEPAML